MVRADVVSKVAKTGEFAGEKAKPYQAIPNRLLYIFHQSAGSFKIKLHARPAEAV